MAHLLLRCELFEGSTMLRNVADIEHSTLCNAFSLDPCSHWFDLPRSAQDMRQGAAGRHINGLVFRGPKGTAPVGKLTVARDGERFADSDGSDPREFFNLSRS